MTSTQAVAEAVVWKPGITSADRKMSFDGWDATGMPGWGCMEEYAIKQKRIADCCDMQKA